MKKSVKWIIGVSATLFALFLIAVIAAIIANDTPEMKQQRATAEFAHDSLEHANEMMEQANKKVEDDLLTAYVTAERTLKSTLKDLDSYEEIEHQSYLVKPEPGSTKHIQVLLRYRAKNSFGGYVVSKRYFDFDKSLTLVDSFEEK